MPIRAMSLSGVIPSVVRAYDRLGKHQLQLPRTMLEQLTRGSELPVHILFVGLPLLVPVSLDNRRTERKDPQAIMISHSASPSSPSGRNMLTSPTMSHCFTWFGARRGCSQHGSEVGRERRMNVSSAVG